jgi:hypothetical protein
MYYITYAYVCVCVCVCVCPSESQSSGESLITEIFFFFCLKEVSKGEEIAM